MSKRVPAVAVAGLFQTTSLAVVTVALTLTFTATERPLPEIQAYMVMGTPAQHAAPQIEDMAQIWWVPPELADPLPRYIAVPARQQRAELRAAPPPTVAAPPAIAEPPPPTAVEQWRPLVQAYWPPELVEWALAIMACESGGNPSAKNRTSSAAGLFQFLRSTWDRGPAPALGLGSYDSGAVYDPETNIRAAAWLYANWGGTSQWECKA